ncbi:hypothetical protein GOBAR_DD15006 [Gossypium barbadense]|nr:hypothetical protein GOBAR_DD15006 [Gossypium barbadense]
MLWPSSRPSPIQLLVTMSLRKILFGFFPRRCHLLGRCWVWPMGEGPLVSFFALTQTPTPFEPNYFPSWAYSLVDPFRHLGILKAEIECFLASSLCWHRCGRKKSILWEGSPGSRIQAMTIFGQGCEGINSVFKG